MEAVTLLTKATTRALIEIARIKTFTLDPEQSSIILRQVLKANLERVINEWQEGLDAGLSNRWLQELVKAQAVEIAQEALEKMPTKQLTKKQRYEKYVKGSKKSPELMCNPPLFRERIHPLNQ